MNNEKEFKKPSFIIFTDRDGTLNLDDEQLSIIFKEIQSMDGMVVPITGRTVGDLIEGLQSNNLPIPPLVIGDNGGAIYYTRTGKFLRKKTINYNEVTKIIKKYIEIGGNPEFIRYTDGKNIFAYDSCSVRNYYKKSKVAFFYSNIYQYIQKSQDLSKITLAGQKKKMEQMTEFVEKLGFWTDMDKTKFPEKKYENYRLDITLNNINKGDAVKAVVVKLKPSFYVCIGDGINDVSMFKQALKDGQEIAIMSESSELINDMREYQKKIKRGMVRVIPNTEYLANRVIVSWMKGICDKKIIT